MKLFLVFITLCVALPIQSQITIKDVAPKVDPAKAIEIPIYDSTRNFLGADVYQYIGQELYLLPKPKNLQKYGYDGFILDYSETTLANDKNVYKCCDGFNSKYIALQSKTFKVIDVIEHPKKHIDVYKNTYYLKLIELSSSDTVYFEYRSKYSHSFKFVILGFFEKEKNNCLGTELIVRGKNWRETIYNQHFPLNDINNGEPVPLVPGSEWTIVDLTIETEYYSLSYILQNNDSVQISLPVDALKKSKFVLLKNDCNDWINNYPAFWEKILERKVVIGMTEKMVRTSWGDPDKIIHASYGDQWIYGDQYLYFENGKMTAFN